MKITAVRIRLAQLPSTKLGANLPPVTPLGVLSIETDEGLTGETFITPPNHPTLVGQQIVTLAGPMLLGRNPLDIGAIWNDLAMRSRLFDPCVQGLIDVALWDIAGKAAGLPLHRLLGSVRTRVPAYVSSWHHETGETYAEEALAYRDLGISAYKLHPPSLGRNWGGPNVGPSADIDACRAVREAMGPEAPLFCDSACTYGYDDAVRVGHALEDLGYVWYEDPLPASALHAYVRLKQQLRIPILATEMTVGGLTALGPWVTAGATDYLRGDVVIKGGVTGMMKIAHLAEAFDMNCEVHDAYNGLNNVATLHVCAAIRNCSWFEIIVINPPGKYGFEHLNRGLAEPFVIDKDGAVVVPERPGLGVDIDWDLLKASGLTELS